MAEAFSEWRYVPLDLDSGELPERFRGVVFSNEFFDALPVDVAVWREGAFREQRVALDDGARSCGRRPARSPRAAGRLPAALLPAARRRPLVRSEPGGARLDGAHRARAWSADSSLTIDYGYTRAESVRFPAGTLMGYRRHHGARERVGGPRRARHHRARELHRARRARRALRFAHACASKRWRKRCSRRAKRDQFARRSGRRRLRGGARAGACSSRRCCSAWERRSGCCCSGGRRREEREERPENEKGPENRGLGVETCCDALVRGAPMLLLFLRSSFLLRGGFLGCALHRLILPNIKFCDLKIAM